MSSATCAGLARETRTLSPTTKVGPPVRRSGPPDHDLRRAHHDHELDRLWRRRLPLQAKLELGRSDDPLEHEADRVADQVLQAPSPGALLQRSPRRGGQAEGDMRAVPSVVSEALASPGRPLEPETRTFFEPRLRLDLDGVRVHDDAAAAASASAVDARAYTVGSHVVFGEGRSAPSSAEGRRLIAHELVHVAQQRGPGDTGGMLRRSLVYASGYPRRFASDAAETRCAEAAPRVCEWAPASIDFEATATRSGGGVGRASFATLLSWIEGQAAGSITELGLIGHANSDYFGLSGRITAHDVFFTPPGLIGVEAIAANAAMVARVRDRFAPDAVITLYGCHAGVGDALLDALSRAFRVCVRGFSDEILTCIEWSTPSRHITSRGKVFDRAQVVLEPPPCKDFHENVRSLVPNRQSCVGVPQAATPAADTAPPRNLRWTTSASLGAELEPGLRALGTVGARLSLRSDAIAVFNPIVGLNILYAPAAAAGSAHLLAAVADVGLRIQRPLKGAYLDLTAGGFVGFEAEAAGTRATTGLGAAVGAGWRWERVELGPEVRALLPLTAADESRVLVVGRAAWRF